MGNIISLVNQKGGVGKTTTSVNLSAALARQKNHKILLIDMDPQGNASRALSSQALGLSIYDVLSRRCSAQEAIQKTDLDNLFLISSDTHLAGAEVELTQMPSWEYFLKEALESIQDHYDYIFIDCPPSLGPLTVNVLVASNQFIVPLQCEYYALEGLGLLTQTVRRIRETLNPSLQFVGILLTMFDGRNRLSHQVEEEVRKHFEDKVFQTIVPRNVRLSEAPSFGKSIFQYDPASLGARRYLDLSYEFSQKISTPNP